MEPGRIFSFDVPEDDIKTIRNELLQLTQVQFAAILGISVETLREWEQGRKKLSGAAISLLKVAAYSPDTVLKALVR